MSIQKVRAYMEPLGIADRIREFDVSSATVELAAVAVGVEGARIAKSLSFKVNEEPIIIVAAGDAKVDNAKYKAQFHTKAKMLTHEEAHTLIGHDVGRRLPLRIAGECEGVSGRVAQAGLRRCSPPPAAIPVPLSLPERNWSAIPPISRRGWMYAKAGSVRP